MPTSPPSPAILRITYGATTESAAAVEEWLGHLRAAAAAVPGFLGTGVDRTVDDRGVTLVASFKFASEQDRDSFTTSSAWADLHADQPPLLGVPLEARSVEGGPARVSEVVTALVPPQHLAEYQRQRSALDAAAARFPGFVDVETFQPASGQPSWTTVLTFDSERSLQAWRDSSQRAELVAQIRNLATEDVRVMPTGFGQWFSVNASATAQAPAWKQAMTVLAVLYAMVSVLDMTLGNFIGKGLSISGDQLVPGLGLPFPVVVFVGNAVGTILLTWVLMPVVTRLLAWWLNPAATPSQTWRGVALLVVIYALEMLLFVWIFRTFSF